MARSRRRLIAMSPGPPEPAVTTGVTRAGDAVTGNGEGIMPRAGERRMIYSASRGSP